MKRNLHLILSILFLAVIVVSCNDSLNDQKKKEIAELKKLHKENLEKSPFTEQLKLTKAERKKQAIPPNKYYEEMWELTMNPALGRPTPEKLYEMQQQLLEERANELEAGRVPGDAMDNGWIERGPNNVGGRTRAVMFDPNDPTNETAFAGGVSGGLWVNTNISNPNSEWSYVGISENQAISSITFDPNDTNTFYVGTGEAFPSGSDAMTSGNGVWKSEDGGATWTNVLGGITGDSYFISASNITVNSPGGVAGDYQSYPTTAFGSEITSTITADFVLANDPSPTGNQTSDMGCNAFGENATGRIALIRRGECNFDDKVRYAEDAGAVGVIMMNNVPGEPVPMGGDDTTITIPSVMISMSDGDTIEAAMASGTVNGSLNPSQGDLTGTIVPGIQFINDVRVRDNGGASEIFVAAASSGYVTSNAVTYVGGLTYGVYKSVDGGSNWTEINLPLTAEGNKHNPMDIEIGSNGNVYISSTNNLYGNGGGKVFKSTDGNTFTEAYAVTNGGRTQIAVSGTAAGKVYILSHLNDGGVAILRTTTDFIPVFATQNLTTPNDSNSSIPSNDFTNGQGWYDLGLDVDPTNDNNVYVGGINVFKSTNSGDSWSKISYAYQPISGVASVHADQHIVAFGHGDSSKLLYGNDGGVYYSDDAGATSTMRNNGYNTSQFYTVGVAPTTAFAGDYFGGGLQDNGTQLLENADTTGPDSAIERYGGDGAYTFFDQDGTDQYFIRNYVYNSGVNLYNYSGTNVTIENESASNGSFINPQALDSNLDILYSNYSSGADAIVRRYSGIKSAGTLTKTSLTDGALTTTPTAFTVSTHTTSSSTLLIGSRLGDVILVENADGATPTWTGLDGNILVGSVSDMEFGQSENEIFVTMHNWGVNNVWYTSDQGTNWEAKDGNLPDIPVKTIIQNPLNLEEVLIGTELGVWYTNDFSAASPSWTQAYNGMSGVKVLDMDLRDDNMVFAASLGRGIFSGQLTAAPLGVDENVLSNGINMYPTVSNGEFTIKATQNFGDVNLNVFNLSGQKVYSSELELSNNTQGINLNLASGLYLAQFTVDNVSETKRIIIK